MSRTIGVVGVVTGLLACSHDPRDDVSGTWYMDVGGAHIYMTFSPNGEVRTRSIRLDEPEDSVLVGVWEVQSDGDLHSLCTQMADAEDFQCLPYAIQAMSRGVEGTPPPRQLQMGLATMTWVESFDPMREREQLQAERDSTRRADAVVVDSLLRQAFSSDHYAEIERSIRAIAQSGTRMQKVQALSLLSEMEVELRWLSLSFRGSGYDTHVVDHKIDSLGAWIDSLKRSLR